MRFLGLILLFFTFTLNSFSQKGKIEGKVTDAISGLKLSGVTIAVDGEKGRAFTNTDGYFQITLDAGKKYIVTLSSVGYSTKELADVEVKANEVTHLDITLEIASTSATSFVVYPTEDSVTIYFFPASRVI